LVFLPLVGKRSTSGGESWVTELTRKRAKNIRRHPWCDLLTATVQEVVRLLRQTVHYWEMQGYTRDVKFLHLPKITAYFTVITAVSPVHGK